MIDKKERNFPINFRLTQMPKDVHDIITERQAFEKMKNGWVVSMENVMYKIIRESKHTKQNA